MKAISPALFIIVLLLSAHTVHGASKEQCDLLRGTNPNIVCDESTPIFEADEALGITDKVAQAKQYLLSIARNLRNSKAPPTCEQNIYRLNNTLAVCSAHFLKAYNSVYGEGSAYVVSAYRPPKDLGDGCGSNKAAGGAQYSNHAYGLALDIAPTGAGSTYKTLHSFARSNPQFGVCFPYLPEYTGGSFYDAPHLALAGIDTGEAKKCAQQGVTSYCSGSPTFDPTKMPDDNYRNTVETEDHRDLTDFSTHEDRTRPSLGPTTGFSGGYSGGAGAGTTPTIGNGFNYDDLFSDSDNEWGEDSDTSASRVKNTFTPYVFKPLDTVGSGNVFGSVGEDNSVSCTNSGLFGISLFNTCTDESRETTAGTTNNSSESGAETSSSIFSWVGNLVGGKNTPTKKGNPSVVTTSGALDVFSDVHRPTNTTGFTGDRYASTDTRGVFVSGDRVHVEPSITAAKVVEDSTRLATQSVRYGAYFGFLHALSPLVVGSAPRTLFRIAEQRGR